jgi:hypothetical protein
MVGPLFEAVAVVGGHADARPKAESRDAGAAAAAPRHADIAARFGGSHRKDGGWRERG